MHAWADISHKLAYKKKEQAPPQFMRQLNRLSAILEEADEKFNTLKNDRENYIDEMSKKAEESGQFDVEQDLNLDSLQAFLDFYFPDRISSPEDMPMLLDEIMDYNIKGKSNISFKTLLTAFEKSKDCLAIYEIENLNKMDKEEAEELKNNDYDKFEELSKNSKFYSQIGVIRRILRCYLSDYKY